MSLPDDDFVTFLYYTCIFHCHNKEKTRIWGSLLARFKILAFLDLNLKVLVEKKTYKTKIL